MSRDTQIFKIGDKVRIVDIHPADSFSKQKQEIIGKETVVISDNTDNRTPKGFSSVRTWHISGEPKENGGFYFLAVKLELVD